MNMNQLHYGPQNEELTGQPVSQIF